jgi:hypothetical protein
MKRDSLTHVHAVHSLSPCSSASRWLLLLKRALAWNENVCEEGTIYCHDINLFCRWFLGGRSGSGVGLSSLMKLDAVLWRMVVVFWRPWLWRSFISLGGTLVSVLRVSFVSRCVSFLPCMVEGCGLVQPACCHDWCLRCCFGSLDAAYSCMVAVDSSRSCWGRNKFPLSKILPSFSISNKLRFYNTDNIFSHDDPIANFEFHNFVCLNMWSSSNDSSYSSFLFFCKTLQRLTHMKRFRKVS